MSLGGGLTVIVGLILGFGAMAMLLFENVYLLIREDGLLCHENGKETTIAWADLEGVKLDGRTGFVVFERRGGAAVSLVRRASRRRTSTVGSRTRSARRSTACSSRTERRVEPRPRARSGTAPDRCRGRGSSCAASSSVATAYAAAGRPGASSSRFSMRLWIVTYGMPRDHVEVVAVHVAVEHDAHLAARLEDRAKLGALLHEREVREAVEPEGVGEVLLARRVVHEHDDGERSSARGRPSSHSSCACGMRTSTSLRSSVWSTTR